MHKDGILFTINGVAINKEIEAMKTQSYLKTAVNVIFAQVARYSQMSSKKGDKNDWGGSSGGDDQRI